MWKAFGALLVAGVGSEILYRLGLYLYLKYRRENQTTLSVDPVKLNKVLFFPDNSVACKRHFLWEEGCTKETCKFSHEQSSLSELFFYLNSAKESLDVCVFTISCEDLADLLVTKARAGVRVRIITDDEQVNVPGSQIWKMRAQGIALRTDNSSYFMHHKFVIVDGSFLMNGSFNWTRQAITGNQENLMILGQKDILRAYQKEFNKLWELFDPRILYA